jgi:translation initiation factor 2B subunit (eIF-2B alpha/beta/delta family)
MVKLKKETRGCTKIKIMEQTFEEYLKKSRGDFTKVVEKYTVENHLELRTAIDSLLIAYDQAVHQSLSSGAVISRLSSEIKSSLFKLNEIACYYQDDKDIQKSICRELKKIHKRVDKL